MRFVLSLPICIVLFFTGGCKKVPSEKFHIRALRSIPSPAAFNSGEPNLFAATGGRVILSWVEADGQSGHALRFSEWQGEGWGEPGTIARGNDWFVNWADFPSVIASDEKRMAAHWLVKSSEETFAYHVNISQSVDGGVTWSEPLIPHRDGTPTEHGFVSLLPYERERVLAVWLDGRNYAAGSEAPAMTLRAAFIDRSGELSEEVVLDEKTCDCCQTSAARTGRGIIVAYRDRTGAEVRDISVVHYESGKWSSSQVLFADGWQINGCPVNGPAVAAMEDRVAIAWFTAAQQQPRIQVAFSRDGGVTFETPVRVDDGNPIGRVDAVLLADGSAVISWVEAVSDGAEIRLRRVTSSGEKDSSWVLAPTSPARASGFPQMAGSEDRIYLAWTDPQQPAQVRTAMAIIKKTDY